MFKKILFASMILGCSVAASAHTVLLEELFDDDPNAPYDMNYKVNFPVVLELDHKAPTANINTIFMDANGVSQPWMRVKDVSTSSDGFIASHSQYQGGGKSNDWLGSVPVTIPSKGFILTFDAQSGTVQAGDAVLSDLWLFITEEPLDSENMPVEPTKLYEQVSAGESPSMFEGEFTNYTLSLDDYVGKTIYINFANLNENRQLLCLDNIRVIRFDDIDLTLNAPRYAVGGESVDINVKVSNTSDKTLSDLTVSFSGAEGDSAEETIASLAAGESKEYTFATSAQADGDTHYKVTVSSEGMQDVIGAGILGGVAYRPEHRILIEEATGAWCGNCPLGMYNFESMMLDEEMKDMVVPVSVHINQSATNPGVLTNDEYAKMLGLNYAPTFRMDRGKSALAFSVENDTKFDKTNPKSVAYTVYNKSKEMAMFDIKVSGEFMSNGKRINKIAAKAEVTPVRSTSEDVRYALGFIITENNVSLPGHVNLTQENYYSGYPYESELGGFTLLPKKIRNMRFQDVAREIYDFNGNEDALPSVMNMNETYTVEQELALPETYRESNGVCSSPAIVPENLSLIAFLITVDSHDVVNCAVYPMSEQTEDRFTIRQIYEEWKESQISVSEIDSDGNIAPEYFTLDGMRITAPTDKGIYIVHRGGKVSKEIIR